MISANKTFQAKRATQSIFLVCGLALSSWAPMVPLAKERLSLNDANLGLLLLLLGGGAIVMMPVSGLLSHKYGTRKVILGSGILTAFILPMLLIMPSIPMMAVALFLFGSGIGTVDVAMNSQGVHVQNSYGKPIMSSLHGLFSVGGLIGSLVLGLLIKAGLAPIHAAITISIILLTILAVKYPKLLSLEEEHHGMSTDAEPKTEKVKIGSKWLHGSVIFLGTMCFIVFLSEGAMLDWSALFLSEGRHISPELAGVGYAAFSVAMATMRMLGDRIVSRLSGKIVVIGGGLIAGTGLLIAVSTPWVWSALLGFILLGIGAANIVPVFFTEGGKLKNVPPSVAIPIISTMGYAGQLAGPALLGFVAFHFTIVYALGLTGLLLISVAITYGLKKSSENAGIQQKSEIWENSGQSQSA